MSVTLEPASRKDVRFAMRLRSDLDRMIRDAAAATGRSMTDFVTEAAVERATDVLIDRRMFWLDETAWAEFTDILDRPAQPVPGLTELLGQRAPWDEG